MALPALKEQFLKVVPPQSRGKSNKESTEAIKKPPPIGQANPQESRFELITSFGEARMQMDAFLEGIYNTAIAEGDPKRAVGTIMVFCSMAQDRVKVMDKVFETLTEGKEE